MEGEEHPLYGNSREVTYYSVASSLNWLKPLGFDDYFVSLFGEYRYTDAIIGFFDRNEAMAASSQEPAAAS